MFFDGISIVEGSSITNLTVAHGTDFPLEPSIGELFYKTSVGLFLYNGSDWNQVKDSTASVDVTAGTGISISGSAVSLASGVVTTGTYSKVTVDTYGRVTSGTTLSSSDIPNLDWSKITSGKPTTLAGYGITDAQSELDADLVAIAALSGTSGLLKKTAADTWTLDTSTYLTENQSITVSGDVTGSGTTAITTTLASVGTAGTYRSVTTDAKGRVTAGTNPTTLAGYGITDAAPISHVSDATIHLTSGQNTWIDAITATAAEVNYLSGVTSSIQTQLGTKANLSGATFTGNIIIQSGSQITLNSSPAAGTDAVNKAYVDAHVSGLHWKDPVNLVNLVGISTSPIGSPLNLDAYIIDTGGNTGDWSIFSVGDVVQYSTVSGWLKVKTLEVGDRYGVSFVNETTPTGFLSGKLLQIATITNATAGSVAATFQTPTVGDAVWIGDAGAALFGRSYTYVASTAAPVGDPSYSWIQFSGPGDTVAGTGLYYSGNTIHIALGAGIAELPANEVGIEVHSTGGLMTTTDGTASSTATNAKLSLTKVGTAGTYRSVTTDAHGRVTAGTNPTTLAGYGITDAQALDADLTAIAALSGTSGILKKTAADTWSLDTSTYLTSNQSITVSGDVTGSGTTAITTTLASVGTAGTYTKVTTDAKGRVTAGSNPTTLAEYGISDAVGTASPAFTGIPTAPTASVSTNTTQIATTAFVQALGYTTATASTFAKRDASGDLYAVNFVSTSDRRQKEEIKKVEQALDLINALEGVTFRWKNTANKSIGVIAQDVEEVLPSLVFTGENGQKSVNYDGIIGVLIEAVKELTVRVKTLEEK